MNLFNYLKKRLLGKIPKKRRINYDRVRLKITKIKNPKKAYKLINSHLAYFNGIKQPIDIDKLIKEVNSGTIYSAFFYDAEHFISSMNKIGCKVERI